MKLHMRVQPSGSVAVEDEAGHLVKMVSGGDSRLITQARAFMEGFEAGLRAAKIDRNDAVDRALAAVEGLR